MPSNNETQHLPQEEHSAPDDRGIGRVQSRNTAGKSNKAIPARVMNSAPKKMALPPHRLLLAGPGGRSPGPTRTAAADEMPSGTM